jgi:DNA-binding GntR family transcriptional regulator
MTAAYDVHPNPDDGLSPRRVIVRDIIKGLYEGRYVPGQRLVEVDLTSQYGASRGPVREALNWLSAQGIVVLAPQRGAQIRKLTLAEAIDVLVAVDPLIGTAARLASTNSATSGVARGLKKALSQLIAFSPSDGSPEAAHARDRFYGELVRAGGNFELARIMPGVLVHLVRVQYRQHLQAADPTRHEDYEEILREVLAPRPSKAESAARKHVGRSIAALRGAQSAGERSR